MTTAIPRARIRRPLVKIAAFALAAFVVAGSYGAPIAVAHALDASVVRLSIHLDDGRRDPASRYFLSVKFWGVCVRLEWIDARHRSGDAPI
jgi:hypothetical protein